MMKKGLGVKFKILNFNEKKLYTLKGKEIQKSDNEGKEIKSTLLKGIFKFFIFTPTTNEIKLTHSSSKFSHFCIRKTMGK